MKETKKLFVSQPMRGKTDLEIINERLEAVKLIEEKYPEYYWQVIDSFLDISENKDPLWYLGKSIQLLGEADLVIFMGAWNLSRGCRIENECCVWYGIPHVTQTSLVF